MDSISFAQFFVFFNRLWNPTSVCIGLEKGGEKILCATGEEAGGRFSLIRVNPEGDAEWVKGSASDPFIMTCIEAPEVLIRTLKLPITKTSAIEATLSFQAEALFPYPLDQAILTYQIVNQSKTETELAVFGVRRELLAAHLEFWRKQGIEPEKIASTQSGLMAFGAAYFAAQETYLMAHLQNHALTLILIDQGRWGGSFSSVEKPDPESTSTEKETRLCQMIARTSRALLKDRQKEQINGIVLTGDLALQPALAATLTSLLGLPLLTSKPEPNSIGDLEKRQCAVPIGLALLASQKKEELNFCKGEFAYPAPWKRMKRPLLAYFSSMALLCLALYCFGQAYLSSQENVLKRQYSEFIAEIGKSHEELEALVHQTNGEETQPLAQLNSDQIADRIAFLQGDLRQVPDSFPLFPNIPLVSDLMAWLARHPAVAEHAADGEQKSKVHIEHLSYVIVRRPTELKKQDRYQIKVELDFTTAVPKWAREFHDALIAPNDWIDPKAEIKWNASHGHYKTSFYLKDKTLYPGGGI